MTPGERVSGSRILRATAEDNSGTVARVEFSVSGSPVCVDDMARRSASTFSCTWHSSTTPPGEHQLTVKAQDAAGNSALSAPVSITVLEANRAPTLGPVSTTHRTLDEGSAASLVVTATDPDGDTLTYTWTQSPFAPLGTFAEGSNATPSWTAPLISRDTTFLLKVTVTDGRGARPRARCRSPWRTSPPSTRRPAWRRTSSRTPRGSWRASRSPSSSPRGMRMGIR